jgi:hypothetical protein
LYAPEEVSREPSIWPFLLPVVDRPAPVLKRRWSGSWAAE